jgi:NADPH:quinone reductase-like Zn-dependent oxidoreductase
MVAMLRTTYALAANSYGPLENLRWMEVPLPEVRAGEVRVRVHASSVNPSDAKTLLGKITLLHAKVFPLVVGWDVSGVVDELGAGVTGLSLGQEVFGFHPYSWRTRFGAFAEYTVLAADCLAPKPETVTHETAAATATVGLTALQALRDAAHFRPGDRALVTGASGGVGALGLGVARMLGGSADAVTSTRGMELVRSLGAERVFDRTSPDWIRSVRGPYQVVLDAAAAKDFGFFRGVLAQHGTYVTTLLNRKFVGSLVTAPLFGRRTRLVMVKPRRPDLELLGRWLVEGLRVPIVSVTPVREAAKAMARLESSAGVQGKLVIRVAE